MMGGQIGIVSFLGVLVSQVKRLLLRLGFLNLHYHAICGDPSRVKLGKNVGLNNAILNVASGQIIIGDNVIFGHCVMLTTGTHNYCKVGTDRIKAWPKSGWDIVMHACRRSKTHPQDGERKSKK